MKRSNKKLLTFMLAGALCAVTAGGALSLGTVKTSAAKEVGEYALSDIFLTEKAIVGCDDSNVTTFSLSDNGVVKFTRDLAFKWYEGAESAKYLALRFAFQDMNFEKVEFVVESASAWASSADKASNVITFTKEGGAVAVSVNGGTPTTTSIQANTAIELSLAGSETDGSFNVTLKVADGAASKIGAFVNVGENYSGYAYNKMIPLQIKADMPDGAEGDSATTVVALNEINGQSFENIKKDGNDYLVKDTAAPVLVVNEEIGGFLLGTKFDINYEKVDVLQDSNLTGSMKYYQWSPKDETTAYVDNDSTSFFFNDLVYEKDGKTTSVYMEEGAEYVSVKITLGDKVFKDDEGDFAKKTYELTWYADEASIVKKGDVDYIVMDRNTAGATYSNIVADAETSKNVIVDEENYQEKLDAFQKVLEQQADKTYVGQNFNIPSIKWLIEDNNGYRNLNFIVSYKTVASDTAEVTNSLAYNKLQFAVKHEGLYEFKIFAKDKAGNEMKYYLENGELASVTAENVWDIEEIPSFKFEIKNKGLIIDEATYINASQRKAEEDVGDKYTLSDLKVYGAASVSEDYALYRVNEDKANAIGLTTEVLASVDFKALNDAVKAEIKGLQDEYFTTYFNVYAKLLADKLGEKVTVDAVKACFEEINEFDDAIDEKLHEAEWNKSNKYNWSKSSQSFTVAEVGNYVILADYWMEQLPAQRAMGYKVVFAESEANIIAGEKDSWFETNLVSVILFSIAGVLLVIIIILLFIKPSDESLEDIDAKAKKAVKSEDKKSKKE